MQTGGARSRLLLLGAGLAGAAASTVLALVGNSPARDDAPVFWPWLPPLSGASIGYGRAALVARLALVVLILAWLAVGLLARRGLVAGRAMAVLAGVWSLPLLLAPPGTSNDLYAYVASGRLQSHGFDPYTTGPQVLAGSEAVLRTVGHSWRDTPSPYGPGFLLVTRGVGAATGEHFIYAVVLLRLLMVASLVAAVWFAIQLARPRGRSPRWILWLLALNPLVLSAIVSTGHNDILMVALVLAGFWLHERGHSVAAVLLLGLGLEVKVVAVVAMAALVVHAVRTRSWRAGWQLAGLSVAGTLVTTTLLGLPLHRGAFGGWGWIKALNIPGRSVSALTPVDAVWDLFRGAPPRPGAVRHQVYNLPFMTDLRVGSLGVAALVCLAIVIRRSPANPMAATGAILGIVCVTGSVVWPWYFVWPLALLAIAGTRRQVAVTAAASIGTVLALTPGGPIDWGQADSLVSPGVADLVTVLVAVVLVAVMLSDRISLDSVRARVRRPLAVPAT